MEETKTPKKKSPAWPIAITVIVLSIVLFATFFVKKLDLWVTKAEKAGGKVGAAKESIKDFEGKKGSDADEYHEKVIITATARITQQNQEYNNSFVAIKGTIKNTGSKKVVFMKAGFTFPDKDGQSVYYYTDLLAHKLPFGSNNSPVRPKGQKSFMANCQVPSSWDGKTVNIEILELGLE